MRVCSLVVGIGLFGGAAVSAASNGLPVEKIYGVNLGGWLLTEPWMLPNEWVNKMGGERCDKDCSKCAASEFGLVKKLGQEKADKVFAEHWETWFTEKDVNDIVEAGLNSVRIPLGYWIVESLVDRSTEHYPRGGIKYLKKGLSWLKNKGIHVMLDHHALPGVAAPNQMYAGNCSAEVNFYKPENYRRALIWGGVMTALTHIDPDFSTVFAIQAVNQPLMDAQKTEGYGDYQKQFVKVVRAVEYATGIECADTDYSKIFSNPSFTKASGTGILNVAECVGDAVVSDVLKEVAASLKTIVASLGLESSVKLRRSLASSLGVSAIAGAESKKGHGAGRGRMSANGPVDLVPGFSVAHGSGLERKKAHRGLHHGRSISDTLNKDASRTCVMTSFQNRDWQYHNPPNPADAAIGPQVYDSHLYFAFGYVADPNVKSYMGVICNTNRVKDAMNANNSPLVFGEWSLATEFKASEEFLRDWADAQKYIYAGQANGWIFWSFKIEEGSSNLPHWSYFASLKAGYFTKDPSQYHNPDVCKPWMTNGNSTSA